MNWLWVVGLSATVLQAVMFAPQAVLAWKYRSDPEALRAVSLTTQVVLMAVACLWAVYGIGMGAVWSAVPSLFTFPLALFMGGTVLRARLSKRLPVVLSATQPAEPARDSVCGRFIAPAGVTCLLVQGHAGPCSGFADRPEVLAG